ncbi:MAG: sigma-70 family RNA polymerase sigma factor [Candidatus Omnitrophota bacterium]|nr:sigma-70 family RNA polymerase sigma factor [Candidatus Omnitrophota bacterium]
MFDDATKLIERCINREEKAWREFIEKFTGLVYYSAKERLKRSGIGFNEEDIRDIVQNVFVEIWERSLLASVRERHKIKAWLSVIGQTRALNFMRGKRERTLGEDEMYKIENLASCALEGPGQTELEEALEKAIEGFPVKEKIILKLNLIHGKTHREISDFMKLPINTVSTIIARKKGLLRKQLDT